MEPLEDFIEAQVKSVLRTPNAPMPRPAGCLLVKKIAVPSVASHLGVAERDLLAFVDGGPAARHDPALYRQPATRRAYTFYSRSRHETIEAVATGIEVGVDLAPTVEAIKAVFDPRRPDFPALQALWEARDWGALEALAGKCLEADRGYRETPVFLFLGAALWEQKRFAEAAPIVEEYLRDTAPGWTMNFTGIGLLYHGLEMIRRGEADAGRAGLQAAWEQHAHPRIADALEKHQGARPAEDPPRWVGKTFPRDYALPRVEGGSGTVALGDALRRLRAGQLLPVCLLATYRGNGPYDDFMARYNNFATHFAPFVPGLHVITMEPTRRADRAYYFENEDRVRAAGLPMELLLDPDGELTRLLEPPGSPHVLLLDGQGRVAVEGELTSVELWTALAAANPPRGTAARSVP